MKQVDINARKDLFVDLIGVKKELEVELAQHKINHEVN